MIANNNSLTWFQEMFAKYPPLSPEEEKALIKKYSGKKNREKLEELLVLHNLALIPKCVKKYVWAFDDKADAWMFGVQALVQCAKTFNPKKNCRFNTWAYDMIWRKCARQIKDWHNEIDERKVSLDAPEAEDKTNTGDGSSWRSIIESKALDKYKIQMPFSTVSEQSVREFTYRLLRLSHVQKKYIEAVTSHWLDGKSIDECAKMSGTTKKYMRVVLTKARFNIFKGLTTQIESDLVRSGKLKPAPIAEDFEHKYRTTEWRNGQLREVEYTCGMDWVGYKRACKEWEVKRAEMIYEHRKNLKDYISL